MNTKGETAKRIELAPLRRKRDSPKKLRDAELPFIAQVAGHSYVNMRGIRFSKPWILMYSN